MPTNPSKRWRIPLALKLIGITLVITFAFAAAMIFVIYRYYPLGAL